MDSRPPTPRPATDDAPLRPTPGRYLHYAWFALAALLVTIPMSLSQFISHQFHPTARNFKRNARRWGRAILRALGIRTKLIQDAPLDPDASYVFVANHQNLLDILVLADVLPYPFGFVAKAELEKVPFLGFAIRNSASLFIDKSDPRRAVESLQEAGARIRGGNSVLVFPEGERSYRAPLLELKKGAFTIAVEAGVPVVPVTLLDAYRLMDERRKISRPGTVHVVVGTPIEMAGRHRRDIPAVMAEVQAQMEAALARGA